MSARLHYPTPDESGITGQSDCGHDVGMSLCGRPLSLLVNEGEDVTCRSCIRIVMAAVVREASELEARAAGDSRRAPRAPRSIGWHEALLGIAHLLGGPPVVPVPALTREVWRAMDCRRGELVEADETVRLDPRRITPRAWDDAGRPAHAMRCGCPVCLAEEASLGASANWEAEQQIRPHRRHECDFGSLGAMLTAWVRHRRDGATTRSNTGATMARLTEAARLEANVQTTQRFDREDLAIRRTQQAVDVDRFVRRAFAEEQERRGLPLEVCVDIVATTVSDKRVPLPALAERVGASVQAVRALIKHARRAITIEAAAAGYIPMPRAVTGLVPLVERRMAEAGE